MILDKVHNSLLICVLGICLSYAPSCAWSAIEMCPPRCHPLYPFMCHSCLSLDAFWRIPPLLSVWLPPSWLPPSASPPSVVFEPPPPSLSLFPLLPPPLYVSSCITQHKLCRCVCGGFYLLHSSALFRTHFLFKSSICKKPKVYPQVSPACISTLNPS